MKKRLLALVLTVVMVVSLVPAAVFASDSGTEEGLVTDKNNDNKIVYVSLGDSTTNGYGLTGYEIADEILKPASLACYNYFSKEFPLPTGGGVFPDGQVRNDHDGHANYFYWTSGHVQNVNGLLQETPMAYPNLFAQELKKQTNDPFYHIQLAVSAMRADDVAFLLTKNSDASFVKDTYSGNICSEQYAILNFTGDTAATKLPFTWRYNYDKPEGTGLADWEASATESMAQLYQNSVSNADVITINLGSNNFSVYIMGAIKGYLGIEDVGYVPEMDKLLATLTDEEDQEKVAKARALYAEAEKYLMDELTKLEEYAELKDALADIFKYCEYTFISFCVNYERILDRVSDLNGKADVIIMPATNYMSGFKLKTETGTIIDLSKYVGYTLDLANAYVTNMAAEKSANGEVNNAIYVADAGVDVDTFIDQLVARVEQGREDVFEGYGVLRKRMINGIYWLAAFMNDALNVVAPDAKVDIGSDADGWVTVEEIEEYEANGCVWEGDAVKASRLAYYMGFEKVMIEALKDGCMSAEVFSDMLTTGDLYTTLARAFYPAGLVTVNNDGADPEAIAASIRNTKNLSMLYFLDYFWVNNGVMCHPSEVGYADMAEALENAYLVEDRTTIEEGADKKANDLMVDGYDFLKNDKMMGTSEKLEMIDMFATSLSEDGTLGEDAEKALQALSELNTYLSGEGYIDDQKTLDIIVSVYAAILNGMTERDVKDVALFIYNTLTGSKTPVPVERGVSGSSSAGMTTSDKLAIITNVYKILDDAGYLAEYASELAPIVDIYNDIANASEEDALEVFEIVFYGVMEPDTVDDAVKTDIITKVADTVMNSDEISTEAKIAIVQKVAVLLDDTFEKQNGEDILSFIINNPEEVIALIEEYGDDAFDLIVEYYDDAYAYAYKTAKEEGYIDTAADAIDDAIAALKALDLSAYEMTDAFRAEAEAEVSELIEALEAAKALLLTADELDGDSLNALIAALTEASDAGMQLVDTLKQAGVDVTELAVIPFLKKVEETAKALHAEAVAYITEKLAGIEIPDVDLGAIEGAIAELETAITDIKAQIAALKDYTGDGVDGLIDELNAELAEAEAYLAKLNALVASIEDLVNEIENEPELTIEKVQAIVAQAESLIDDTMNLVAEVETAVMVLAQVYENVIPQLLDAATGPAKDAIDATGAELNALVAEIEASYEDTVAALTAATANIEYVAIEAAQSVAASVAAAVEAIAAATETAVGEVVAAVEPAAQAIYAEAEKLAKAAEPEVKGAADAIIELLDELEANGSFDAIEAEAAKIAPIVDELVAAASEINSTEDGEAFAAAAAALAKLAYLAGDIYDIADDVVIDSIPEIKEAAHGLRDFVLASGDDVAATYEASVEAIETAADEVIAAVSTAISAYEAAVTTAANEIIPVVESAAAAIAGEVVTAVDASAEAVAAVVAQVEDSAAGVAEAWIAAIEDATHGVYKMKGSSLYVAIGDETVTYNEELAEMLGLTQKRQNAKFDLDNINFKKLARADLVTLTVGSSEIEEFVMSQARGAVAELIKSNDKLIGLLNSNVGAQVKPIVEEYLDLNATVAELDWDQYLNAEGKTALDAVLAEVKSTFIENEVPEVYVLDLGEILQPVLDEQLGEGLVTVDIQLEIPAADLATSALEWCAYACAKYAYDYAELVDTIQETATKAHLVVTGVGNAYEGLVVDVYGMEIPVGEYAGYAFKALDLNAFTYAMLDHNITYALENTAEAIYNALTIIPFEWWTCDGGENCACHVFTDLKKDAWYHNAICYCYNFDLMIGMSADKFEPSTTTSRAMIVTTLYRLEGEPEVTGENSYKDVKDDVWYTDAIIWATENGIVNGYGNGLYGPHHDVTREQIATMLYRYADYKGVIVDDTTDLAEYTDADEISAWALDAMKWANAIELVEGRTETTLNPKDNTMRSELATLLYRWCHEIGE